MNAFAQQDTTTVYANPGYNKDPMRSKWIPKVEKQDGLWVLNLYNKKQVLQEKRVHEVLTSQTLDYDAPKPGLEPGTL
jgi:hypothetical protein